MSDIQAEAATPRPQYEPGTHPDLPPPAATVGVIGWLRTRLFSSVSNTILTLLALLLIYWMASALINFLFIDAVWDAKNKDDCRKSIDGACWGFIWNRLDQFVYGRYPDAEMWRVNLWLGLLVVAGAPLLVAEDARAKWMPILLGIGALISVVWLVFSGFGLVPIVLFALLTVTTMGPLVRPALPWRNSLGLFLILGYPIISFFLLSGGLGLTPVDTNRWGGFMLTLVIAITGIAVSLPLGVVLALGRRSRMPVVKTICVVFIEFWRGVPLITVLYMAATMFPFFLPQGVTVNLLILALVGYSLFASAYMAEVVRGGLQALPRGQYEAADALGLNYLQSMRLIVLPQALKIVIPGIVNTFIGLFKDTTLVLIIGLFDFLGIVQAGTTDSNWLAPNVPYTGYLFVAIVFFICCYGMSRYSRGVERRLDTGHKR